MMVVYLVLSTQLEELFDRRSMLAVLLLVVCRRRLSLICHFFLIAADLLKFNRWSVLHHKTLVFLLFVFDLLCS